MWLALWKEVDRPGSDRLNCFAPETEFLTNEGLRQFSNCSDGESVTVLSRSGSGPSWRKATVRKYAPQPLYRLILSWKNRYKEIYTTANHLWLVREPQTGSSRLVIKPTVELERWSGKAPNKRGDKIPVQVPRRRPELLPCKIAIQHGIVFGDGTSSTYRDTLAHIFEPKKELLKHFTAGFRSDMRSVNAGAKYGPYAIISGLPYNWKTLPSLAANREYLLGFIMGWLATDGSVGESSCSLSSATRENLVWARSALNLLGILSSDVYVSRKISPFTGEYSPLYTINLYRQFLSSSLFLRTKHKENLGEYDNSGKYSMQWTVESVERTDRYEDVWCVEEPETQTFTLADGLVTHNCQRCDLNKWRRSFGDEAQATRTCFYSQEEIECTVAKLDQDGNMVLDPDATDPANNRWQMETRVFTRDSLLQYLVDLERFLVDEPAIHPFARTGWGVMAAVGLYRPDLLDGICPRSLEEPEYYDVMRIESHCNTYHALPCSPPVVEAQPRHLMDAFAVIQGVRSEFQIRKMEDHEAKEKARQEMIKAKGVM